MTFRADDVRIAHLHSHFISPRPLQEHELRQWQEALAAVDTTSLGALTNAEEEWLLIRHLDLRVGWSPASASLEAGLAWSRALQDAVGELLAVPDHPDVVRYRSIRHGLADLIYRCALGEAGRQWAWQRMGFIERAPQPAGMVLAQGVAQLLARPGWIWPMVGLWLAAEPGTGALTALLRALPEAGWQDLLVAAPASAPYARLAWRLQASVPDAPFGERDTAGGGCAVGEGGQAPLLDWLRRRPHLAAAHRHVLTVLLAAQAWPDQGSGFPVVQRRFAAAQAAVDQAAQAAAPRPHRGVRAGVPPTARETGDVARRSPLLHEAPDRMPDAPAPAGTLPTDRHAWPPAASNEACFPAAPALPEADLWVPTAWAGSLFWLRALGAPGVLAELLGPTADQAEDARGHALLALARALGVPDGDPAQRAFIGGHWPQGQAQPGVAQAAQALARRWEDALATMAVDLPAPRLQHVCQRPGRLRFEAGWIALHLRLDQVDTRLRRLGLDLDPGYLPWLGCVVRIVYD